jgi:hypothetical protein
MKIQVFWDVQYVNWEIVTDILADCASSIFGIWQSTHFRLLVLADGGSFLLQNISNYLTVNAA